MREHVFIGAALGWGAQIRECQHGPEALLLDPYFENEPFFLIESERCISDGELSFQERLQEIHAFNTKLASEVCNTLQGGRFPVVLGGDHSVAVGTWNGVNKSVGKPFGLLWIDAHMDSHTSLTTPSKAIHGMPLAGLLGQGDRSLSQLLNERPVLFPENVVLFGVRSFEQEEEQLLNSLGVRIMYAEEIHTRGVDECLLEALDLIGHLPGGFGVSLDFDFFDPLSFGAIGSPEEGGFSLHATLPYFASLMKDPRLNCLEIVEYNPMRDEGRVELKKAVHVIDMLTNAEGTLVSKKELSLCSASA